MINKIIMPILNLLVDQNEIKEEEIDIYYFGLECVILKIVHYISYILIGLSMHAIWEMLISACVFKMLRCHAGGYHAKTRMGCYIFSCMMVLALCVCNRINFPLEVYILAVIISDIFILTLAPIDNVNNVLDDKEKKRHKKEILKILLVCNIAIIIMLCKNIAIFRYCISGLSLVALALVLEIVNRKYRIVIKNNSII